MKKSSKLLALLLVLVLSLSVVCLAACDEEQTETKYETVYTDKISNLEILYESDSNLINKYSLYVVDEKATFRKLDGSKTDQIVTINTAGAIEFVKWMSLKTTQTLIASYGILDYQESLFNMYDTAYVYDGTIAKATDATKTIRISTTTSVNDTNLLDGYLVPLFEKWYGYDVEVDSAGTGAALNAARMGNADVVLVHSPKSEYNFIAEGYAKDLSSVLANSSSFKLDKTYNKPATDTVDLCPVGNYSGSGSRLEFMYNYFVLVGPKADPAGCKNAADIKAAFNNIYTGQKQFISRGDASGTHNKEITLWPAEMQALWTGGAVTNVPADIPQSVTSWYISAGQGMGACLTMANEKNAYVLSDKGTYLRYKNYPEQVVVK